MGCVGGIRRLHRRSRQSSDRRPAAGLTDHHARAIPGAGGDPADRQQDPEVIARTKQLEQLKGNERIVQTTIDELSNERSALSQRGDALSEERRKLEDTAWPAYERALFWQELRIFGLRLALALPMLLIAAWLALKKRKSDYWPISRGFVLAAVFVFFVELVPYLPSYGGYIRYGIGIVLTFAAGDFLIKNMRHYLANRQEVEAKVERERRKLVSHDEAFKKMSSKVCPGCDRPIAAMEGSETNFCVHCGMTLFDDCGQCGKRKMAFFRFCMSCGNPSEGTAKPQPGWQWLESICWARSSMQELCQNAMPVQHPVTSTY
jgi:hypothetical protein